MPPKRKRSGTATSGKDVDHDADHATSPVESNKNGKRGSEEPEEAETTEDAQASTRARKRRSLPNMRQSTDHDLSVSMPPISSTTSKPEDIEMEQPPPAGLVHPVGYKTNDPPKDRAVRVYADGVFDLCHLG